MHKTWVVEKPSVTKTSALTASVMLIMIKEKCDSDIKMIIDDSIFTNDVKIRFVVEHV